MSELIICEHEYGGYAVRPIDWSGIWTQDTKLKDCCHSVAVFEEKEDAVEYVRINNLKESSRLLELPCAVGDTIYEVFYDELNNPQHYICKYEVQDISAKAIKFCDNWEELENLTNIYFDRDEAEDRLRELLEGGGQ